jgi:hypothetical protein
MKITGQRFYVRVGDAKEEFGSIPGAQLFFITPAPDLVMAVEVNTRAGFQVGTPQRLFAAPPPLGVGWSPDPAGSRFLVVTTPDGGTPAHFRVVVNWAAALDE